MFFINLTVTRRKFEMQLIFTAKKPVNEIYFFLRPATKSHLKYKKNIK
jgi:hypothetical protein